MGRSRGRSQSPASPGPNLEDLPEGVDEYAVIQLDRAGRIVQWDAMAEKIFGYRESDVKGKPVNLLFPPEHRDTSAQELQRAILSGMAGEQGWHVRKDGSRCWVSGTLRAVRDDRGGVEGFYKIVRDRTPQKLQELRREALIDRERSARVEAEKKWKGLEEILENVPAMIALVRLPEQSYVFVNRSLREASRIDLVGRTLRDAHPEISPEFFEIVDRVAATGEAFAASEWQVPLRSVHDTTHGPYFDVLLQPMHSEAGHYDAILLFASDVSPEVFARQRAERLAAVLDTKRARLEQEVRDRKHAEGIAQEQAALLDLAQDSIVTVALDGTILFWNRGAEQSYGWARDEALGRRMQELLHTDLPVPRDDVIRALLTNGKWSGEVRHTTRDGRVIEELSCWVLRRGDGQPDIILQVDRDITARKRMEARFRESQKLESLGVLAGGVAHDFNNLLTSILGNVTLARDRNATREQIDKFLARAEQGGQLAADLVKQMLAYAGKGQFLVGPVDLSAIVRDAVSSVRESVREEIDCELELAERLPTIQADSTQLQRVAINLTLNAVEAIEGPGKVVVRTCVREIGFAAAEQQCDVGHLQPGRAVVLEVQDNGTGIEEAVRPKIFDPFFTTRFAGRGLGLAAVAGIVRMLNGAIRVVSRPGEGTDVAVFFPAGPGVEAG